LLLLQIADKRSHGRVTAERRKPGAGGKPRWRGAGLCVNAQRKCHKQLPRGEQVSRAVVAAWAHALALRHDDHGGFPPDATCTFLSSLSLQAKPWTEVFDRSAFGKPSGMTEVLSAASTCCCSLFYWTSGMAAFIVFQAAQALASQLAVSC
jgi:hypothetical protein